jgi:hypothetical protein
LLFAFFFEQGIDIALAVEDAYDTQRVSRIDVVEAYRGKARKGPGAETFEKRILQMFERTYSGVRESASTANRTLARNRCAICGASFSIR